MMASVEEKTVDITSSGAWILTKQVEQLTLETDSLKREVKRLREATSRLENAMNNHMTVRIIDVKDIPFEEAKKKIYEYYKAHENEAVYPDEIADELELDLKITMEAVEELLKEDKLEVAE